MRLAAVIGLLFSLFSLSGCSVAQPPPTPDIPATVAAAGKGALPTFTPVATPDVAATVQAQVAATIAAVPTHTPTPIPTPSTTPTPTSTPSAPTPTVGQTMQGQTFKQYSAAPLMTIDPDACYKAHMTTNKGNFTIELFASEAPITVKLPLFSRMVPPQR